MVRQFLQVITEKGYIPYIIRSDRGKETPLAAEVHFALSRTMNDNPHFKLNDCWFYGTSTANQRVESWWSQLQKSQLYFWRVGFILWIYSYDFLISFRTILSNFEHQISLIKIRTQIKSLCLQFICRLYEKLP